ncbi:MAG TPA: heat-inducible transcriptional repressor HrcA [Virgibacillus sp.]|nr:heat-inducible transcriptional repressor HrcA [Virgibacillus sp.]
MLTARQLLIFKVITDDFIESAHPVGSRAISEKKDISLSAATIRNVMAELEELGFLEKTHSSSGRIPSEKGYRYYVDHLISPAREQSDIHVIKHMIQDGFFEFEQIVQMSAEVLSDLTNYTSIILGPELLDTKLKQLQIITLSKHSAVAILITDTGHVEHRSFSIPTAIHPGDLEKMVNILNDRLYDVPIVQLSAILNTEIVTLMKKYVHGVDQSFMYLKEIFAHEQPIKLYIGGKSNILMQPEFKDVNKVHPFFSMMEKEDELVNLLKNKQDGIKVTIGNENKVDAIKNFSLITASYELSENQMGTIALLGPTRMEYRKVINILSALSNEMTDALNMWDKDDE